MKKREKVLATIILFSFIALSGCTSKPQTNKKPMPTPRPTESSQPEQHVPSPIPSSSPALTPTPQPFTPTPKPRETAPANSSSNLLQAAIEISCFLSNNDPGTPGVESICQKYGVTMRQVSDYHNKAYKKELPTDEQAAYDAGYNACR